MAGFRCGCLFRAVLCKHQEAEEEERRKKEEEEEEERKKEEEEAERKRLEEEEAQRKKEEACVAMEATWGPAVVLSVVFCMGLMSCQLFRF